MKLNSPHSKPAAYALAVLWVLLIFGLRYSLKPLIQDHAPLIAFILSTLLATWFEGLGPGLLAGLLGALVGDYFFIQPYYTLGPRGPIGWTYFIAYCLVAGAGVAIIEAQRRAQGRAEQCQRLAQSRGEQLLRSQRQIELAGARIRELAAVVESAHDAIISTTLAWEVCSWNPGAERLFGYSAAEMLGRSLLDLVPAQRLAEAEAVRVGLQKGQALKTLETLRRARDGRLLEVSVCFSPVHDAAGTLVGLSAIARDISERKAAEAALQEKLRELRAAQAALHQQNQQLACSRQALELERSRYRELFDSAPVGYILTSRQGIIQQVNLTAARLLNERAESLVGLPLARLLAKPERARFFTNLSRLSRHQVPGIDNWEATLQPRELAPFPCALSVNRVQDEPSRLVGLRWILRDITERRQNESKVHQLNAELEQRVRQRTLELEAANRELEAFGYSVSHDLRAPLRSVYGFNKALLEEYGPRLDEQGCQYLHYAIEAGQRMHRLIDDLMDLSRVTRGELHSKEVDLSALATLIVAELRKQEPQRAVEVEILPKLYASGDEGLLRIALENLLANAWKFTSRTQPARIELGAIPCNGTPLYFVRDNGAGFSMARAQRLFGVFQRLHSLEEFPGTGVGLATVKRIFVRHGGDIWAEAKVNQGATFYFTLPTAGAHGLLAQPQAPPAPLGLESASRPTLQSLLGPSLLKPQELRPSAAELSG